MATDFKINGTTYTYLINVQWADSQPAEAFDGTYSYVRWRTLQARGDEAVTQAEFDSLYALEGQAVSVTCSPWENPAADYVTYYQARIKRVASRHAGPLHTGVVAEIEVRV